VHAATEANGFNELMAPASWRVIEFISDLHLGEDTPRTLDQWSQYMRATDADAVFILGDLFEVWVGDDARHAAFEARCIEILREAAACRFVAFMAGNRDFLLGPTTLTSIGVPSLDDPTVLCVAGERLLLSHGDALCLADEEYQRFRRSVRSLEWQEGFLALPLDERRARARQMRAMSAQRQRGLAPDQWGEVDSAEAVRWMQAAGSTILIHGHTHRPMSVSPSPGFVRHVLSDWDMDHGAGHRAQALRWQSGEISRRSLVS